MKIFTAAILTFILSIMAITIPCSAQVSAVDKLIPLNLQQVKVGGEIGRRIDITVNNNLLVLNVDKDFLLPFQEKKVSGGYVGLGKLIDATVRFAVYTNDDRVITLKNHLIGEVIKNQLPDGYIGLMNLNNHLWGLWDIHEMIYLVYGLVTDYRFFKDQNSLDAAKKTANYIIENWHTMPINWPNDMYLVMAITGIDRAFLALSLATGDERYRNFCIDKLALKDWDLGIVLGRHGKIEGHAYAYMARCMAQTELYRIDPDEKLLDKTNGVINFLTREDGLSITGTCGYQECWTDNQQGFFKLGETCATAYLIRLLDSKLRLDADSRYGDIMERTIYNALFAAQSPDGRRLRYYAPFEGSRIYFDRDTYCCPCNFRRIIAELPNMIYYKTGAGVAINLYTQSSASVDLGNELSLKIRQETDYPNSGKVTICIDPSQPSIFPLKLRIPRWCTNAKVSINGQATGGNLQNGIFFTIERNWKPGDRVELDLPMEWRVIKGRRTQEGRAAVMRGPVLFCLTPELNKNINVDLKLLRLDPASLDGPGKDITVRPDGMACRVKMWNPESYVGAADLKAVLTEFPDPAGQQTFFLMPDPKGEGYVEDELVVK